MGALDFREAQGGGLARQEGGGPGGAGWSGRSGWGLVAAVERRRGCAGQGFPVSAPPSRRDVWSGRGAERWHRVQDVSSGGLLGGTESGVERSRPPQRLQRVGSIPVRRRRSARQSSTWGGSVRLAAGAGESVVAPENAGRCAS